jgi:hypothetical protein
LLRQLLHPQCRLSNVRTAELRHPHGHAEWIASHAPLIPRHPRTLHSQCLRIVHCCTLHPCTTHRSSSHQSSRQLTDAFFAYQMKRAYAQSADALDSRGGSVGINVHTSTAMWHNAIMYCESFHNSSHDCLLASTQCSTSCTLLARPCLPRLDDSQPIVNHPARLTIDRCLHHVATSTLLTNVAPSQASVLHASTNSRPSLSC